MEYYEQVMSLIPPDVKKVVWDEYFMYKRNQEQERNKKSWLKVLSKYPGLKAALITAFLTLLLYLLLEMRRKQRIIPVVAKPKMIHLILSKPLAVCIMTKAITKPLP
ncbi:MAG: hypothetical protein IPG86_03425 [Chitinophagaceae bacterium]|nr:hypothetical protein [Chitinophagaceae bacterium]